MVKIRKQTQKLEIFSYTPRISSYFSLIRVKCYVYLNKYAYKKQRQGNDFKLYILYCALV